MTGAQVAAHVAMLSAMGMGIGIVVAASLRLVRRWVA